MNRLDFRILMGAGLVLLGGLLLLDRFGLVHAGIRTFLWAVVFLLGAAYFLYRFALNVKGDWWAVIPGSALLGIGLDTLLSGTSDKWSGLLFLVILGLGFIVVYATGRERWWSLIPGGVLITLGVTTVVSDQLGLPDSGGLFFLGLGITFFLVAILASMQWAYIPGVILLVLGALVGTPFAGVLNFIWPVVLILGGIVLIFRFARRKE